MAKGDLGDAAAKALTRPGAGPALLAGLGVYTVLALQVVLGSLVYVVSTAPQDAAGYLLTLLPAIAPIAFGGPLPFAIGVFLCFWQLAPVSPQLRMAHVVTRALLAALAGAVVALAAGFVATAVAVLQGVGPAVLAANAASIPEGLGRAWHTALPAALNMLVDGLVVVPLAALLLWGWQRSHPPATAPSGALDEV